MKPSKHVQLQFNARVTLRYRGTCEFFFGHGPTTCRGAINSAVCNILAKRPVPTTRYDAGHYENQKPIINQVSNIVIIVKIGERKSEPASIHFFFFFFFFSFHFSQSSACTGWKEKFVRGYRR